MAESPINPSNPTPPSDSQPPDPRDKKPWLFGRGTPPPQSGPSGQSGNSRPSRGAPSGPLPRRAAAPPPPRGPLGPSRVPVPSSGSGSGPARVSKAAVTPPPAPKTKAAKPPRPAPPPKPQPSPAGTRRSLLCYSKVNLALAVGPPDERGFHPIASWVVPIDLADELELEVLPEGETSRYAITWADDAPHVTPIDWPIEKDLCVKAHRLLEEHAGKKLPLAMTLRKRTPVGGGLGGGSSDCGTMLRVVNDLFALGHTQAKLHGLASRLGSDVAFFIDLERPADTIDSMPRPSLMTGLGQGITRIPSIPGSLVLLVPPFGTPTGPVYQKFDTVQAKAGPLKRGEVENAIVRCAGATSILSDVLFNDLTIPAERVEPRLAGLRAMLSASLEMPVHVTGSGSTMFVVAPGAKEAKALVSTVKKTKLGVVAVVVKVG